MADQKTIDCLLPFLFFFPNHQLSPEAKFRVPRFRQQHLHKGFEGLFRPPLHNLCMVFHGICEVFMLLDGDVPKDSNLQMTALGGVLSFSNIWVRLTSSKLAIGWISIESSKLAIGWISIDYGKSCGTFSNFSTPMLGYHCLHLNAWIRPWIGHRGYPAEESWTRRPDSHYNSSR